jgi:hypothetical protein
MAIPAWVWGLLLFTVVVSVIGVLFARRKKDDTLSTDDIINKTGFEENSVVSTTTETDSDTGEITTTSTDASGKTMQTKTSKDGSTTKTTVKDKDGNTLADKKSSAFDTIKELAPTLLQNIAAGAARDLVLVGGTKLLSKVSKNVAENGVKSAIQQGGKVVSRQGAELGMKFMGYMTKEAAEKAANAAAEKGLRKVAKEAAEKAIQKELTDNAAKYAGKKVASEVTDKALKEGLEKIGQTAAEKAAKEAVKTAEKKVVKTAAEKAMVRGGEALAVKAATKAGVMAAKMGAKAGMGPVGWALMAFDVLSLAIDIACCGGYCEVADTKTWEKERDEYKKQIQMMIDDSNKGADDQPDPDPVRWPIITGPFDKLESAALQQRVVEKAKAAMADSNNSFVKNTMDKLKKAIEDKQVTDQDGIDAFLDENLDMDGIILESTKSVCTDLKGKVVVEDGKFSGCSWPDQTACEGSFKWGKDAFDKDKDTYSSWNKEKQECNKDPLGQLMNTRCDGLGFPYDKDKKICQLNREYCLQKGLKWDGTNCKLEKGQEIAEMMFGTTVVRGLNSLYSADQYEPCPPGARPAGEIAALAAGVTAISGPGAVMLGTYLGQTLCASDKCPDGQDRVSGLCYEQCKPGYNDKSDGITGAKVQGMCYKCPEGFKKTTAGMCHREGCDANLERGTGGGIGLCYPKCTDKFGADYKDSNGMSLCLKQCPPGMDTLPLTCQRQPQTKSSASAQKTCPPGWSQSIAGPGGMCRKNCGPGQKEYGGVCYDNNVDTALLVKTPSKHGCDSGQRDDGTSCWDDLKCTTDWCPGKKKQGCCLGPFWSICNTAKTTCSGSGTIKKNLFDRQYCPAGYDLRAGMCYAKSSVPESKSLTDVGQCNDASKPEGSGGMCYQKCSDFGPSFHRTAVGLCQLDAMTTSRDPRDRGAGVPYLKDVPADQYSRQPLGISYKVFPKKRKIPFGKGPHGC